MSRYPPRVGVLATPVEQLYRCANEINKRSHIPCPYWKKDFLNILSEIFFPTFEENRFCVIIINCTTPTYVVRKMNVYISLLTLMAAMTNSISIHREMCLVNFKHIKLTQCIELYSPFRMIYHSYFYEIKLTVQLLVYLDTWRAGACK